MKTIGSNTMKNGLVDLRLAKYKPYDKFTIAIPMEYVRQSKTLTIRDGTISLLINVRDLYTLEVSKKDRGNKDAYLNIHIDRSNEVHIPRGKKVASKAYEIKFDYQYGKDRLEIKNLVRPGKLILQQDTIAYPNNKNTKLYRLDQGTGSYVAAGDTSAEINARGKYILLSDR